MWVLICLNFQNPVRATPPLMWTYPKAGSPSCYRSHHRSCMETWVNKYWCSAHRLHPWNRIVNTCKYLANSILHKWKKKLFWNGKVSLRCGNAQMLSPIYKEVFFLINDFALDSFQNSVTFNQCTVVKKNFGTGLRCRMQECRCQRPEASASMPMPSYGDWVRRHTICDEKIM